MDNINNLIKKTTDIDINGVSNLNLKDNDVIQIWNEVSSYIEKYMSQSKGVSIPGFATFSFVQKKTDIGNNKFVLVHRPVFVIAEKFAQTHALIHTKYPVAGNIPVHPLNYAAIANETPFSRDDIETCVKHVLQVFNRSVQSRKNVEFTFNGIGKLQIRNSKVKMKFFKEFVNTCDKSGTAVADMQNRPNTCDSVMSRNELNRPNSKNTCILPRINSRAGAISAMEKENANYNLNTNTMDTIDEETIAVSNSIDETQNNNKSISLAPIATLYSSEDASSLKIEPQSRPKTPKTPKPQFVSASKFHIPDAYKSNSINSFTAISEPNLTKNEADLVSSILNDIPSKKSEPTAFHSQSVQLVRPSSRTLLGNLLPSKPSTPCGHQNAGQELCYLCHQRQRRNVPVYLHEETRQKELEENQLLMQYQHLKDMENQLKDEEKRNSQRLDRARMDAFNLGITEALKNKRKERPKTSDLGRSYVFRKRVKTPPKYIKQTELSDYLSKQVESKQKEALQSKQELEYLERMEQLQLAEELAAQREAFLKEKMRRQNELKNSLDNQVKNKAPELPRVLPDGEVFGQYDAKNERLMQQKQREIHVSKFNKETVEQRKREDLLNHLKEQEQDAENLERVREEFRIDRANRFERMLDMRKNLQKDWHNANLEKKLRDKDEKEHRLAHDGFLVHEQCDKYKKCAQCQRDVKNCGESNLWKESRYTAGARLMV